MFAGAIAPLTSSLLDLLGLYTLPYTYIHIIHLGSLMTDFSMAEYIPAFDASILINSNGFFIHVCRHIRSISILIKTPKFCSYFFLI